MRINSKIPSPRKKYGLLILGSSLLVSIGLAFDPILALSILTISFLLFWGFLKWEKILWFVVPTLYLGFNIIIWPLGKMEIDLGFPFLGLLLIPFVIHVIVLLIKNNVWPESINWEILGSLIALISFLFVSLAWTQNIDYGLKKASIFLIQAIIPSIIFLTSNTSNTDILKQLGFSIQFLTLVLLLQLIIFGEESLLYPDRRTLPGMNPIWLSRVAILGVAVSIWNLSLIGGWKKYIINLIVVIGSFWIIIVTGSRGPTVAIIVAFLFILIFNSVRKIKLKSYNNYLFIGLLGVGLLLSPLFILPDHSLRYLTFAKRTSELNLDVNFTSRIQSLEQSYDIFIRNPLIGIGAGGYANVGREYPHNLIAEILAEGGVIGLFLLIIAIGSMVKIFITESQYSIAKGALLLTSLLFALSSGDLASNYEWVIIGTFLSQTDKK